MVGGSVSRNPFSQLYRHQELIRTLVRKDVVGRYRGSFMGLFWTVLHPVFNLLLYSFLFGFILKVRFTNQGVPADFTLYLLCGMLPWLAFSEGLNRAVGSMLENVNLVKKVVFPLEILPVNVVIAALVGEAFAAIVLILGIVVTQHHVPWTVLLVPLVLIPQVLLTMGLAWFCASVGVFVRDLAQFISLGLTAWMFATPIMYPESMVPEKLSLLLKINPMAVFVSVYRGLFLEGRLVHWKLLIVWTLLSLLVFLAGYAWFTKTKKAFADVL